MAVCALSKAFRRLNIFPKKTVRFTHHSTQQPELSSNNVSSIPLRSNNTSPVSAPDSKITFGVRSINFNLDIPRNQSPFSKIIENPIIPLVHIDEPLKNNVEKSDIMPNKVIEMPPDTNIIEKQAERLIVIRRKKMKKHKRRKFLKRMKFVIRKREIRRRQIKEKKFQAEMQAMHVDALKFDPKEYVAERIHILTREKLPNKWKGMHLPEAMIKEFTKQEEERKAHKERLRTYKLKLD